MLKTQSAQNPLITIQGNTLETTSLNIANVFGRRHTNVIQKIESLDIPQEFNALNFKPVDYRDAKGEVRKAYDITRDGFTLLAMGFTGKKAMQFKLGYIEAFNKMEKALLKKFQQPALSSILTPAQKRDVQEAVNSTGKFREVYGAIKTHFRVATYSELPTDKFDEVMAFISAWTPEKKAIEDPAPRPNYPAETAKPKHTHQDLITFSTLFDERYDSPLYNLLLDAKKVGLNVDGCMIEFRATRHLLESQNMALASLARNAETALHRGLPYSEIYAH